MSKRFTDSEKWTDPWFAELEPSFKLAWSYLLDNCDAAGVIDLSERIAAALIGQATDWQAFLDVCGKRVVRLDNGKLWITGYIAFQYGELKAGYNPHKAAVRIVEKYGLPVAVDGVLPIAVADSNLAASLPQASLKLLDKDQDKDQAKVKKKKKVAVEPEGFAAFYAAYPNKTARPKAAEAYANAVETIRGRDGPGSSEPEAYLLDRVTLYAASDAAQGEKQYIPHPTTWLNQARYDDDAESWRRGRSARIGAGQRFDPKDSRVSAASGGPADDGF